MSILKSLQSSSYGSPKSFSGTLSVVSGNVNGEAVMVLTGISRIACGIILGSAESRGRIEYTLSSVDSIEHEVAFWRPWPGGDVEVDTDNLLLGPVTALRAICTVGSLTYEFVGD